MVSLPAQFVADTNEFSDYMYVPYSSYLLICLLVLSNGKHVILTGSSLALPQIAAIALYHPSPHSLAHGKVQCAPYIQLASSQNIRDKVDASRSVIDDKVTRGVSIYGVSTGFGGSADTRTGDPIALGAALLQHQHSGIILPSSANTSLGGVGPIPLTDPSHGTTMPIPWIRAAMLVRTNSLIRGHSGIRWSLVEKMTELIQKGVVPVVPLRGSISASGGEFPPSSLNAYLMTYMLAHRPISTLLRCRRTYW